MKIKTSELTGAALDWAVAKVNGHEQIQFRGCLVDPKTVSDGGALPTKWRPSTNWAQGGPIIEREEIDIDLYTSRKVSCVAALWISRKGQNPPSVGRTPLIAAMRCYVASKLGDEVEIPEELV